MRKVLKVGKKKFEIRAGVVHGRNRMHPISATFPAIYERCNNLANYR